MNIQSQIRIILLLIFYYFLSGCDNSKDLNQVNNTFSDSLPETSAPSKINKAKIIGAWTFNNHDAEMAAISISADSIFYTSDMQAYRYLLSGDSIVIKYPDIMFAGPISLDNDSLILSDRDYGTIHYYRWKQHL